MGAIAAGEALERAQLAAQQQSVVDGQPLFVQQVAQAVFPGQLEFGGDAGLRGACAQQARFGPRAQGQA